mmetsp:Transcript_52417/g.125226  ORF Transcript_52417/g.125226 Transcript_52417/m.125226 type:complete len:261 (+) Transcript_52417:149-931(+)|eukprot:CAMPEP_0178406986 /NCGR_PEP_ID=MMETSP0689_2-20121128/19195_1 /TAXON_ID=160604 /ORGANISM="Amphidinium massartii, Strain CS-259" /LENGTH=260 /DNA_ID=CAMNT_0020028045 /DNA_START=148 /DNA_END=930 /DNA_ORIENTATION=+
MPRNPPSPLQEVGGFEFEPHVGSGEAPMNIMVRNTFLDAPSGLTPQHMADARLAASPGLASAPASLARSQRRARLSSAGALASAVANLRGKLDAAAVAPPETPTTLTGTSTASTPCSGASPVRSVTSTCLDTAFAAAESTQYSFSPAEHFCYTPAPVPLLYQESGGNPFRVPPPPPMQPPKLPTALQGGSAFSPEPPKRAAASIACNVQVTQVTPVAVGNAPAPKFAPPSEPAPYPRACEQAILPSPPRRVPDSWLSPRT